jgi:hypothetical protein
VDPVYFETRDMSDKGGEKPYQLLIDAVPRAAVL